MVTLTCLHGFSQDGSSWHELAALAPGSYRWLTPDIEATSLAQAAADLVALWERERVQRSHLVGYSQGGRIALWVACNHPARLLSLTTIGAHAGLEGEDRSRRQREDRALADCIEHQGIDWFATYWAGRPIFAGLARRGPAFMERLDAARRQKDPAQLAAQLRNMGAGAVEPFWDQLVRVTAPTLLVAGAEDGRYVAFADKLHASISDSVIALVPAAGHAAHLEQPVAVAALLAAHWSAL